MITNAAIRLVSRNLARPQALDFTPTKNDPALKRVDNFKISPSFAILRNAFLVFVLSGGLRRLIFLFCHGDSVYPNDYDTSIVDQF